MKLLKVLIFRPHETQQSCDHFDGLDEYAHNDLPDQMKANLSLGSFKPRTRSNLFAENVKKSLYGRHEQNDDCKIPYQHVFQTVGMVSDKIRYMLNQLFYGSFLTNFIHWFDLLGSD